MVSNVQVVFLIDLNSISEYYDDPVQFESYKNAVNLICLRLLTEFGALTDKGNERVRWAFKFYNSLHYKPDTTQKAFIDFNKKSLNKLNEEIQEAIRKCENVRSKQERSPNKAKRKSKSTPSKKHENQLLPPCHSYILNKSIQEILLDYNWDRPDLSSPVKRSVVNSLLKRNSVARGYLTKDMETIDELNFVITLTTVPATLKELASFVGKSNDQQCKPSDFFNAIFDSATLIGFKDRNLRYHLINLSESKLEKTLKTNFQVDFNKLRGGIHEVENLVQIHGLSCSFRPHNGTKTDKFLGNDPTFGLFVNPIEFQVLRGPECSVHGSYWWSKKGISSRNREFQPGPIIQWIDKEGISFLNVKLKLMAIHSSSPRQFGNMSVCGVAKGTSVAPLGNGLQSSQIYACISSDKSFVTILSVLLEQNLIMFLNFESGGLAALKPWVGEVGCLFIYSVTGLISPFVKIGGMSTDSEDLYVEAMSLAITKCLKAAPEVPLSSSSFKQIKKFIPQILKTWFPPAQVSQSMIPERSNKTSKIQMALFERIQKKYRPQMPRPLSGNHTQPPVLIDVTQPQAAAAEPSVPAATKSEMSRAHQLFKKSKIVTAQRKVQEQQAEEQVQQAACLRKDAETGDRTKIFESLLAKALQNTTELEDEEELAKAIVQLRDDACYLADESETSDTAPIKQLHAAAQTVVKFILMLLKPKLQSASIEPDLTNILTKGVLLSASEINSLFEGATQLQQFKFQCLLRLVVLFDLGYSSSRSSYDDVEIPEKENLRTIYIQEIVQNLVKMSIWHSPTSANDFLLAVVDLLNIEHGSSYQEYLGEILVEIFLDFGKPLPDSLLPFDNNEDSGSPCKQLSVKSQSSILSNGPYSEDLNLLPLKEISKPSRPLLRQMSNRQIFVPNVIRPSLKLNENKKNSKAVRETSRKVCRNLGTQFVKTKKSENNKNWKRSHTISSFGASKSSLQKTPSKDEITKRKTGVKRRRSVNSESEYAVTPTAKKVKVIVPETPAHRIATTVYSKGRLLKSTGSAVITESPDRIFVPEARSTTSLTRRRSFYSGARSRNFEKGKQQLMASHIRKTFERKSSLPLSTTTDSSFLFSEIIQSRMGSSKKKRSRCRSSKRVPECIALDFGFDDDLTDHEQVEDGPSVSSLLDRRADISEVGSPEFKHGRETPLKKVKRTLSLLTPVKGPVKSGNDERLSSSKCASIHNVGKQKLADCFTPSKRVQFSLKYTPSKQNASGSTPKSILKTPTKTPLKTPTKMSGRMPKNSISSLNRALMNSFFATTPDKLNTFQHSPKRSSLRSNDDHKSPKDAVVKLGFHDISSKNDVHTCCVESKVKSKDSGIFVESGGLSKSESSSFESVLPITSNETANSLRGSKSNLFNSKDLTPKNRKSPRNSKTSSAFSPYEMLISGPILTPKQCLFGKKSNTPVDASSGSLSNSIKNKKLSSLASPEYVSILLSKTDSGELSEALEFSTCQLEILMSPFSQKQASSMKMDGKASIPSSDIGITSSEKCYKKSSKRSIGRACKQLPFGETLYPACVISPSSGQKILDLTSVESNSLFTTEIEITSPMKSIKTSQKLLNSGGKQLSFAEPAIPVCMMSNLDDSVDNDFVTLEIGSNDLNFVSKECSNGHISNNISEENCGPSLSDVASENVDDMSLNDLESVTCKTGNKDQLQVGQMNQEDIDLMSSLLRQELNESDQFYYDLHGNVDTLINSLTSPKKSSFEDVSQLNKTSLEDSNFCFEKETELNGVSNNICKSYEPILSQFSEVNNEKDSSQELVHNISPVSFSDNFSLVSNSSNDSFSFKPIKTTDEGIIGEECSTCSFEIPLDAQIKKSLDKELFVSYTSPANNDRLMEDVDLYLNNFKHFVTNESVLTNEKETNTENTNVINESVWQEEVASDCVESVTEVLLKTVVNESDDIVVIGRQKLPHTVNETMKIVHKSVEVLCNTNVQSDEIVRSNINVRKMQENVKDVSGVADLHDNAYEANGAADCVIGDAGIFLDLRKDISEWKSVVNGAIDSTKEQYECTGAVRAIFASENLLTEAGIKSQEDNVHDDKSAPEEANYELIGSIDPIKEIQKDVANINDANSDVILSGSEDPIDMNVSKGATLSASEGISKNCSWETETVQAASGKVKGCIEIPSYVTGVKGTVACESEGHKSVIETNYTAELVNVKLNTAKVKENLIVSKSFEEHQRQFSFILSDDYGINKSSKSEDRHSKCTLSSSLVTSNSFKCKPIHKSNSSSVDITTGIAKRIRLVRNNKLNLSALRSPKECAGSGFVSKSNACHSRTETTQSSSVLSLDERMTLPSSPSNCDFSLTQKGKILPLSNGEPLDSCKESILIPHENKRSHDFFLLEIAASSSSKHGYLSNQKNLDSRLTYSPNKNMSGSSECLTLQRNFNLLNVIEKQTSKKNKGLTSQLSTLETKQDSPKKSKGITLKDSNSVLVNKQLTPQKNIKDANSVLVSRQLTRQKSLKDSKPSLINKQLTPQKNEDLSPFYSPSKHNVALSSGSSQRLTPQKFQSTLSLSKLLTPKKIRDLTSPDFSFEGTRELLPLNSNGRTKKNSNSPSNYKLLTPVKNNDVITKHLLFESNNELLSQRSDHFTIDKDCANVPKKNIDLDLASQNFSLEGCIGLTSAEIIGVKQEDLNSLLHSSACSSLLAKDANQKDQWSAPLHGIEIPQKTESVLKQISSALSDKELSPCMTKNLIQHEASCSILLTPQKNKDLKSPNFKSKNFKTASLLKKEKGSGKLMVTAPYNDQLISSFSEKSNVPTLELDEKTLVNHSFTSKMDYSSSGKTAIVAEKFAEFSPMLVKKSNSAENIYQATKKQEINVIGKLDVEKLNNHKNLKLPRSIFDSSTSDDSDLSPVKRQKLDLDLRSPILRKKNKKIYLEAPESRERRNSVNAQKSSIGQPLTRLKSSTEYLDIGISQRKPNENSLNPPMLIISPSQINSDDSQIIKEASQESTATISEVTSSETTSSTHRKSSILNKDYNKETESLKEIHPDQTSEMLIHKLKFKCKTPLFASSELKPSTPGELDSPSFSVSSSTTEMVTSSKYNSTFQNSEANRRKSPRKPKLLRSTFNSFTALSGVSIEKAVTPIPLNNKTNSQKSSIALNFDQNDCYVKSLSKNSSSTLIQSNENPRNPKFEQIISDTPSSDESNKIPNAQSGEKSLTTMPKSLSDKFKNSHNIDKTSLISKICSDAEASNKLEKEFKVVRNQKVPKNKLKSPATDGSAPSPQKCDIQMDLNATTVTTQLVPSSIHPVHESDDSHGGYYFDCAYQRPSDGENDYSVYAQTIRKSEDHIRNELNSQNVCKSNSEINPHSKYSEMEQKLGESFLSINPSKSMNAISAFHVKSRENLNDTSTSKLNEYCEKLVSHENYQECSAVKKSFIQSDYAHANNSALLSKTLKAEPRINYIVIESDDSSHPIVIDSDDSSRMDCVAKVPSVDESFINNTKTDFSNIFSNHIGKSKTKGSSRESRSTPCKPENRHTSLFGTPVGRSSRHSKRDSETPNHGSRKRDTERKTPKRAAKLGVSYMEDKSLDYILDYDECKFQPEIQERNRRNTPKRGTTAPSLNVEHYSYCSDSKNRVKVHRSSLHSEAREILGPLDRPFAIVNDRGTETTNSKASDKKIHNTSRKINFNKAVETPNRSKEKCHKPIASGKSCGGLSVFESADMKIKRRRSSVSDYSSKLLNVRMDNNENLQRKNSDNLIHRKLERSHIKNVSSDHLSPYSTASSYSASSYSSKKRLSDSFEIVKPRKLDYEYISSSDSEPGESSKKKPIILHIRRKKKTRDTPSGRESKRKALENMRLMEDFNNSYFEDSFSQ